MDIRRLGPICKALHLSKHRAEQWIARGVFEPSRSTVPGTARELTFTDAAKLLVLKDLGDAGLLDQVDSLESLSCHLNHLHGLKDDKAVLVIGYSAVEIIPPTERGAPGTRKGSGKKVFVPGAAWLSSEIIKLLDLPAYISDPDHRVSIVILLDQIEERVKAAWANSKAAE